MGSSINERIWAKCKAKQNASMLIACMIEKESIQFGILQVLFSLLLVSNSQQALFFSDCLSSQSSTSLLASPSSSSHTLDQQLPNTSPTLSSHP